MIQTFAADLHTHTDVSVHAYSSLYENIICAKKAGLLAVAVTNHGPKMSDGAPGIHFRNLHIVPRQVEGITVLRGVECNLLPDGSIDLEEAVIKNRLDFCIASIHDELCGTMSREEVTGAYLKVAENPLVSIIGHCGTARYPFDRETVVRKWKECGKTVEVNEGTFRVRAASIPNCEEIVRLCKKYEVPICVNSDAHFCSQVGDFTHSRDMLNRLEFPEELVINSSRERLNRWLRERNIPVEV